MNKLRVFEAFAGIGSQSMALRNIGVNYEIVGTMDVDKYAILAYDAIHNDNEKVEYKTKEEILEEINKKHIAYNFSTGKSEIPKKEEDLRKLYEAHVRNKNFGDIRLVDENILPDFDFFTYSFPCKNISNAGIFSGGGFKEGSGTQSSLVWECRRIIKYKKPKFLMMENVKNLIGKKNKTFFELWCTTLEKIGYKNYWKVLNAKNFGLPQNRERVIMISIREDLNIKNFKIPETNNKKKKIKDILENEVDKKFYINKSWHYVKENETKITRSTLANLDSISFTKTRGILDINDICYTIDAMQGGNREPKILVDKIQENFFSLRDKMARKLTPLECWRCQGLSDGDFLKAKKVGISNSKLYERSGRAIPISMLEEIFKEVFKEYIINKEEDNTYIKTA